MFIVKVMRIMLLALIFLAAFFPIYINIPAFAAIEPDEDDDYIILLDETRREIREDGSYITTIHMKYKILKEDAICALGEKEIPYLSETEDVEIIKALVIKPDGKKVRPRDIQDISPYSGFPSYSDLKTKIITMRDLAVGDTLELEFRINAKHSRMPPYNWGSFSFYCEVPIEASRFILTVPAVTLINIKSENLDIEPAITYSDDRVTRTYIWERHDCAKVEHEPMMPIYEDLFPYLAYSTIDDWQKIAVWFHDVSKDKIKPTPEITEEAMRITSSSDNIKDKIEALLKYFKDNIRYVSMSFGLYAFEPHHAADVLENKYGDCKDQSILLIAMLDSLGIEAYPVLVRYGQKDYSMDRAVPSPDEFSHVIVYAKVEGEGVWLDPLEEGLDFGEIPYALTEERVFVIKPEGGEFIDIPAASIDRITFVTKNTIFLEPGGSCTGIFESMPNCVESPEMRSKMENCTARDMELLKAALINKLTPGGEIIDFYITDPGDYTLPYTMMIKFKTENWTPPMGDFMILSSLSPAIENPFSLPLNERDYKIKNTLVTSCKNISILNIPKGYHFEYIPESYEKTLPICRFSLISQAHASRLVMVSESQWFSGEVPLEDYTKVHDFFNNLQKEAVKKIIIKKTE